MKVVSWVYNPLSRLARRINKMTTLFQTLGGIFIPLAFFFFAWAYNIVQQPTPTTFPYYYSSSPINTQSCIFLGVIFLIAGAGCLYNAITHIKADERQDTQRRIDERQDMQTLISEIRGLRQDIKETKDDSGHAS